MSRKLASRIFPLVWLVIFSGCSGEKPKIYIADVKAVETKLFFPAISFFMTIHNRGTGKDVLVSARIKEFPSAKVELHDVVDDRMAKIDKIEILNGKAVHLKPGSLHFMAFKVKKPTDELTLVLRFKESGDLEVKASLPPKPS